MKRIYNNEPIPVQFIHKANGKPIKLDFITSFETSDDTWNRFLGHEVRENIKTYLGDEKGEGYKLLAPYVKAWVKPEKEKEDIRNTLEGILNAV
ncbi:MAG: hypothetical protein HY548_01665 [Elusimicrobia bacterium]|nr:hypothetical protein [Elusimicrobiota bacterium]